jgi:hypothetical protein
MGFRNILKLLNWQQKYANMASQMEFLLYSDGLVHRAILNYSINDILTRE